ncbi:hypothetical protein RDI58_005360 [Solanum bulbocastanum]|uniref:Uncharacterized protein n=1 Tax=Solanum bulbocastanum TaxID=147425 RepID=A0AAN8TZ65_SOLBU
MVVLGRFSAAVSASFGGCYWRLVGSFLELGGWSNGGLWWGVFGWIWWRRKGCFVLLFGCIPARFPRKNEEEEVGDLVGF